MSAYVWSKTFNPDQHTDDSIKSPANTHSQHSHDTTAFSIPWSHINKTKYYTLMPFCNIGVRLLTYPFNLIKTRQTAFPTSGPSGQLLHQHMQYTGTFNAMKTIVRTEGVLALYKGLGVSCFTLTTAPIYLTVLETSRTEFEHLFASSSTLKPLIPSAAGFVASAVQQVFAVPLDVVTQRMMVSRGLKPVRRWPTNARTSNTITSAQHILQPAPHNTQHGGGEQHRTARHIVREILNTQGWRGLYRGFVLSVVQYAPFSAITWQVNAALDPFLRHTFETMNPTQYSEMELQNCDACNTTGESEVSVVRQVRAAPADGFFINPARTFDKPRKPRPLTVRDVVVSMLSGGVSGMIACLATTPIDVIKTRVQVNESHQRLTSGQTLQNIVRERGYAGLAAGTTARVLAVAPSSALLMVSYEVLKRYSLRLELYAD